MENNHQKVGRPKHGRVMLRTAALQFLEYHFGNKWRHQQNSDLDTEDFLQADPEEVAYLKQRHAPRLSDEYMDD